MIILLHWRIAYADDDSLEFLEVPEDKSMDEVAKDYILGVLGDCGIEFDKYTHENLDPYYYVINKLVMPEGFDPIEVRWYA